MGGWGLGDDVPGVTKFKNANVYSSELQKALMFPTKIRMCPSQGKSEKRGYPKRELH